MKKPALALIKVSALIKISSTTLIADGSFKTIPPPLRQLPAKNIFIPEAPLISICFKGLIYYE
jgi:hypothetical protein